MSNFLYGKNKCKITWPLLIYFLINEENENRNNIYDNEISLEPKKINLDKFIKTKKKLKIL